MSRNIGMVAAASAILLAGCGGARPGTSRPLGEVSYELAFSSARDVVAQYFPVERADAEKGVIRSRPRPVEATPEGLLGGADPARKVATLHLGRENGQIIAHLAIAEQRQRAEEYRQMSAPAQNYDSVPNKSPAEMGAETVGPQREVWRTQRYDKALERRILAELYRELHPAEEQ